jgi:hypothetical protein
MPLVVAGAVSNIVAILANGGYMPASPDAMAALGKGGPVIYSNSAVMAAPVLAPLTDIFALPTWMPWANVFSIGDVLIGLGIALVIVLAMHRPAPVAPAETAPPAQLAPQLAPQADGGETSPGGASAH